MRRCTHSSNPGLHSRFQLGDLGLQPLLLRLEPARSLLGVFPRGDDFEPPLPQLLRLCCLLLGAPPHALLRVEPLALRLERLQLLRRRGGLLQRRACEPGR